MPPTQAHHDNRTIITEHLRERFNPLAIVLVGSRAGGQPRPDSDWDVMLFENDLPGTTRTLEQFGEHVLDIQRLPAAMLSESYVFRIPDTPFNHIEILYDATGGLLAKAVANTLQAFAEGPPAMSDIAIESRRRYMTKKLAKLRSTTASPIVFFYHLGPFFQTAILTWFQQRQLWPRRIVEAVPYIRDHDPEFFELLSRLAGEEPPASRLLGVEEVYARLFHDRQVP